MKRLTIWTMRHGKRINFIFAILASLFITATANAQISTGIPPLANSNAAGALLCNILNVMFWVLISVSIIMILWGAWLYVTAGDDAKKPSEARMTILYAVIGIVVALAARGFPLLVASLFPGASVRGCGTYGVANSNVNYNL